MQVPSDGGRVNSIILQHRFSDIDQLAEQMHPFGNVQLTQLSTDRLQCDIQVAVFPDIQFLFAETSCPLLTVGEKARKLVGFNVIMEAHKSCLISHNRKVSGQTLWGFAPDWETRMIVPPKLLLVTVQINPEVLQRYLQLMERSDLDQRFWASNYVYAPVSLTPVRAYLTQLSSLILHQPDTLRQPHFNRLVSEDFIPLLINSIPPVTQAVLQAPTPLNHLKLLKQAEDYMMTHIDEPLTLKDLCNALHSSRTPVFTAFREVYGVGPMEYLKVQRLYSVRRMLKAANPRTDSVTTIARRYGFWSAGHFTRDYKTMFGELPSETLKRA